MWYRRKWYNLYINKNIIYIKEEGNKLFILKQYYKRLTTQGLLKSFLAGLVVGLVLTLITSTLFWFLDFKYYWISFIILFISTAISTNCFYIFHYKQTFRQMAEQIDKLGLEECVLTMTELKDDQSYIAKKQRDDTNRALEQVKPKSLKTTLSISMISCLITAFLLCSGMTAVNTLAANDVISSGKDLVDNSIIRSYDLQYEIEGDGEIIGDIVQRIEGGEDGTEVIAVANDGYAFVGWYIALDGKTDYGDYIGDASQNATEGAKGDSNLSDKGKDSIGGYFNNIGN